MIVMLYDRRRKSMLTTLAQQQVRFEVGQAFLYTNDELPMLFPGDVNCATLSAIDSERWALAVGVGGAFGAISWVGED